MKINATEIRPGMVLEHKGQLWLVYKTQHTMPGKGGAFMQVEMKDVRNGTKLNERFRSEEKIDKARVESKPYQFLFADGDRMTFMDTETYEQVELDKDLIGEAIVYLEDGMMVTIQMHESGPVAINLPDQVTCEITETEPVVKGQTAASSNKPATLHNGVRIMVPPFINVGDQVVVNTQDNSYIERAKN